MGVGEEERLTGPFRDCSLWDNASEFHEDNREWKEEKGDEAIGKKGPQLLL